MWKHFLRWALLGLEIEKCFLFSRSLLLLTVLTYFKVPFEYLFNESVESVHKTHLWCVSQKNRQTTVVLSSVELCWWPIVGFGKNAHWMISLLTELNQNCSGSNESCFLSLIVAQMTHELVLVIIRSKILKNRCWTWAIESNQSECFF